MYVASFCFHVLYVFSDVCCTCVYLDVAYVSHICCKCLIWMLCMFYNVFEMFLQVFQMHVLSVSSVLRPMLLVLHLDVSKVNRVLHLAPSSPWLSRLGVSTFSRRRLGIQTRGAGGCHPLPFFSMLMMHIGMVSRQATGCQSTHALSVPLHGEG
jgi:hypothetical protein